MRTQRMCGLCQKEIRDNEPIFHFPTLHPNHPLADIKGIVHISCLLVIDNVREIGDHLAEIAEDIAKHSESAPLIARQGNIILRYRIDEDRIELLDFENFCEITISNSTLAHVYSAEDDESINLGMWQMLYIKKDGKLSVDLKNRAYTVELPSLDMDRLRFLLSCFSMSKISQ